MDKSKTLAKVIYNSDLHSANLSCHGKLDHVENRYTKNLFHLVDSKFAQGNSEKGVNPHSIFMNVGLNNKFGAW